MPKESGFAFLEWKDTQPENIKKIAVIINTAKNIKEDELAFLQPRSARIVMKEMNFTENLTAQVDALMKELAASAPASGESPAQTPPPAPTAPPATPPPPSTPSPNS